MLYVNMCVCPHGGKQGGEQAELSGCRVGEDGRPVPGELPFCVSRGSCKVTGGVEGLARDRNPGRSSGAGR